MSEYSEHKSICDYLRIQYPDVVFTSDSSGIRMTIGNAKKMLALKSRHKIPDLIIFAPRSGYHGLIIEMKKTGEKVFKTDGTMYANPHQIKQKKTLDALTESGYFATFAIGFEEAKNIIDYYFNKPL